MSLSRSARIALTVAMALGLAVIYLPLLAGALLAFALSFDEIIVTTFTTAPGTRRCRSGSSTISSGRTRPR